MGPGETIATIVAAFVLIAMLIAATGMFRRYLNFKEMQLGTTANMTAEKAAQYASHVERLEQRVRVLERIATDKGADLAAQIEDLRREDDAAVIPATAERAVN